MIVPSQRYTHKDKRNGISSQYNNRKSLQISLNFSTINVDGMLLWNDNEEKYLGMGLENGFLKVVSNLLNLNCDKFDMSLGGYLTDGSWHNVRFDVDEVGQVSLMIDQRIIYSEDHHAKAIGNLDLLGESFFLGKILSYFLDYLKLIFVCVFCRWISIKSFNIKSHNEHFSQAIFRMSSRHPNLKFQQYQQSFKGNDTILFTTSKSSSSLFIQ